jgi:hypothetical protein
MMISKVVQNILLAIFVMAVLCAGTVSAHQLSQTATTTTCRGFCAKNLPCPNVLGCGCVIQPGFTSGVCNLIAAKPNSPGR